MLSAYLIVKLVHIVSATLLFGTGLGTAFYMFNAHRSDDPGAIAVTSRYVVVADWLFTLPAVVLQFLTGLWLTSYLQIPWSSAWFLLVVSMFVAVGLCWLPVVWIQIRISRLTSVPGGPGTEAMRRGLMRIWTALGVPAFLLTLALFAVMVLKPGLA